MDVYRQAADVVQKVREGNGTCKALCLEKQMQKKRQTYAVACETLRRYEAMGRVLEYAQFFDFYPMVDKHLAMVMAYDTVLGLGVKTKQDPAAVAIRDSESYLRQALERVAKEDPSVMQRYAPEPLEEGDDATGGSGAAGKQATLALMMPTYVRVNTLAPRTTVEGVLAYFKKRERGARDEDPNFVPTVKQDVHLPQVLVLPPRTDLHKSTLMRQGAVVVQDKASCVPATVLFDRVPIVKPEGSMYNGRLRRVVDACAAPGNKTTQLAALGAEANPKEGTRVIACEMDGRRAETLRQRVESLHAKDTVTVVEGDFTQLDNKYRSRADGLLVDPSCSASGMVKRIDVTASTSTGEEQERRVEQLARMQEKLLTSALTCFPKAQRVVYSTCSVHERENEAVVRAVLANEEIAGVWALANIMPATWTTRGLASEGDDAPPTQYCIRCDPRADKTSGFFVACFDRIASAAPAAAAAKEDNGAAAPAEAAPAASAPAEEPEEEEVQPAPVAAKKAAAPPVTFDDEDDEDDNGAQQAPPPRRGRKVNRVEFSSDSDE